MAEAKQYITHANENGQIYISEDVISTIVLHTLNEIDGFAGLTTKASADMSLALNPKHWNKAIKVTITDKGSLILEINALIAYGAKLAEVAETIQNSVSNAVSSITGVQPKRVNVNIYGIVRK